MREVIAAARKSLTGGDHRLIESSCSLRNAWFPVDAEPSLGEQLLSDRGALHKNNAIVGEFDEEVNAIIEAITTRSDPRSLKQIEAEGGESAMLEVASERMDRRPMALALWDRHGAPVRLRGDMVFRVVSPRDAMGDPVIRSYSAHRYVAEVSAKTAEFALRLRQAKTSLARWRITSIVLLLLLVLVLWQWVQ